MLALLADMVFGEPSDRYHPVAWLGKIIALGTRMAPQQGKWRQLFFGGTIVFSVLALAVAVCYLVLIQLKGPFRIVYILVGSLMLKFSFSLRGLIHATEQVKTLLAKEDIDRARDSLKSLVSRDTTGLDERLIISATVESAAENLCDSFTAPLLYFFLFGIPGAVAYRVINTFDAMIGYHGKWEYLGRVAARLDDVANYIPARLSGLTVVLCSYLCRNNPLQAWHVMLRDHSKTASPNSGWLMSAFAGSLQVQLEKPGAYKLGDDCYPLTRDTISSAQSMVIATAVVWVLIGMALKGVYFATT